MSLFNAYMRLKGSVDAEIVRDEKLFRHIPYTISSNSNPMCDLYILAQDHKALVTAVDILESEGIPWRIIGKGTSIVPVDDHFQGALLELGDEFKNIEFDTETGLVTAGAACKLNNLVMACAVKNICGLQHLAGIPGTVGGAVRQNVHYNYASLKQQAEDIAFDERYSSGAKVPAAYYQKKSFILQLVHSVVIYNPQTRRLEMLTSEDICKEDAQWGHVCPLVEGAIIVEVTFKTRLGSDIVSSEDTYEYGRKTRTVVVGSTVAQGTDEIAQFTLAGQPDRKVQPLYPFVSLDRDYRKSYALNFAKAFPEGLKVDSAYVDPNYPEFIVHNNYVRKPEDVIECMNIIQEKMKEACGIELEPKITFLGVSS